MLGLKKIAAIATGGLLSVVAVAPIAFAQVGTGGMAGAAGFGVDGAAAGALNTGAATSAAIGKNGAGSWAFNTGNATGAADLNSAGSLGSSGITTFSTGAAGFFDASGVDVVNDAAGVLPGSQANTSLGGPNIQLGAVNGNAVVVPTP